MMHHVIYSNGKKGYGLYYQSNGFPLSLEEVVSGLYVETPFASNQADEANPLSLHFTNVTSQNKDYYIFSYVVRHCTHPDSQRIMFAAVNYVMDADEITECMQRPQETLPRIIAYSEKLLTTCGYQFHAQAVEFQPKALSYDTLSLTQKTELMSIPAFLPVKVTDRRLGLFQANPTQALTMLCWLFDRLPIQMRKYIRFYIGAQALSEAHRVEYVFSDKMIGISTERAPARPRVCVCEDSYIKTDGSPSRSPETPDTVKAYMALTEKDHVLLRTLFYPSEDVTLFLTCAKHLHEQGQDGFFDEWLLETLGDNWFANALRANLAPTPALKALMSYRHIGNYPAVFSLLCDLFPEQIAPTVSSENETTEPYEAESAKPQKSGRKKRDKRETDAAKTAPAQDEADVGTSQSAVQTEALPDDEQADYTELYNAYAPHSNEEDRPAPHHCEHGDTPASPRKETASAEVIFILFGAMLSVLMNGVLLLLSMVPAFLQGTASFTAASITPRAFVLSLIVASLFNMLIGSVIYQALKTLKKRRRK